MESREPRNSFLSCQHLQPLKIHNAVLGSEAWPELAATRSLSLRSRSNSAELLWMRPERYNDNDQDNGQRNHQ